MGAELWYGSVLGTFLRLEASTMMRWIAGVALVVLVSLPVLAALKVGEKAPDFSARASLAGKEFNFFAGGCAEKGADGGLFLSVGLHQRL